jgi:large subunit ribosomal protein L22
MSVTHTNERPGTRAVLRHYHMSASKARLVLDLVRGKDVASAQEILAGTPREAASVVAKVLASAVANAVNNDGQVQEELYIASAFADEGATAKRFRPRARGRAGRIRKRSCHVTIIVARMGEAELARLRAARSTDGASRSRRVAGSRRRADQQSHAHKREVAREEAAAEEAAAEVAAVEEAEAEERALAEDEAQPEATEATEHDAADDDAIEAHAEAATSPEADCTPDDEPTPVAQAADESGEETTD